MNEQLRHLYQEVIVDHGRHPRNYHALENPSCQLEGYNPLCGDKLTLYLKTEGDKIIDISFEGSGCAISMASASLMTQALKGKTIAEAKQYFEHFHHMVTNEDSDKESLGKLAILEGVKEFPARIKCATLAWHTLNGAIDGNQQPISTE